MMELIYEKEGCLTISKVKAVAHNDFLENSLKIYSSSSRVSLSVCLLIIPCVYYSRREFESSTSTIDCGNMG